MSSPSPSPPILLHGSCQCRSVRWTSTSLPQPLTLTNCHCRTCRRLSSSAFLTWLDLPSSALTITPSPHLLTTSPSPLADRTHCARCGSPISMRYHCQPACVSLAAGTMAEEDLEGVRVGVQAHIFLEERAGWWDGGGLQDGAARYERFSPGFERVLRAWREGEGEGGIGEGKEKVI